MNKKIFFKTSPREFLTKNDDVLNNLIIIRLYYTQVQGKCLTLFILKYFFCLVKTHKNIFKER